MTGALAPSPVASAPATTVPSAVRLTGVSEAVREAVPPALVPLFEFATWLGNATFLLFALTLLYWASRRRETAIVVCYGFVGLATVVALKEGLAIPRPPESVWRITTDGYGFPSGHAVAAVVIYGGLAHQFGWLGDRRKAAATGLVIAGIALSRVVLGVHYLGDVLVGLAVGAVLLLVTQSLVGDDLVRGFGLALVAALPAVAVTGPTPETVGVVGSCLGGLLASTRFEAVPERGSPVEGVLLAAVGIPFVVAMQVVADALTDPLVLAAVDDAVLLVGIILLPAALDRVDAADRMPIGSGSRG